MPQGRGVERHERRAGGPQGKRQSGERKRSSVGGATGEEDKRAWGLRVEHVRGYGLGALSAALHQREVPCIILPMK